MELAAELPGGRIGIPSRGNREPAEDRALGTIQPTLEAAGGVGLHHHPEAGGIRRQARRARQEVRRPGSEGPGGLDAAGEPEAQAAYLSPVPLKHPREGNQGARPVPQEALGLGSQGQELGVEHRELRGQGGLGRGQGVQGAPRVAPLQARGPQAQQKEAPFPLRGGSGAGQEALGLGFGHPGPGDARQEDFGSRQLGDGLGGQHAHGVAQALAVPH